MTWIDVVDNVVKIGLGSLITAVSGYLVLLKTHANDKEKERRNNFYNRQEEIKHKSVLFMCCVDEMLQSFSLDTCSPLDTKYFQYLQSYNNIQVICTDELRYLASVIHQHLVQLAFINKHNSEYLPGCRDLNHKVKANMNIYHGLVRDEVTKVFE